MMGKNNRTFRRAPISLKITVSESGDDYSIKFDISDLSEGGIFIKSSILQEPDQKFDLVFKLPNSDHEIVAKGKVARSEDKYNLFLTAARDSSIPGMGIQFTKISEEDKKIIRDFIESEKN